MRFTAFQIAGVLTAAYLIVMAGLLAQFGDFSGGQGSTAGMFNAMSFDAFGNLLAGVFAPIAFVWVAVTVHLQSKQLEAQATQLEDQRNQLRNHSERLDKSVKAMIDQVDATKNHAALTAAQNEIFKRDEERSEREQADERFDEMIVNFQYYCVEDLSKEEVRIGGAKPRNLGPITAVDMLEPRKIHLDLIRKIDEAMEAVEGLDDAELMFSVSTAAALQNRIESIYQARTALSAPHRAKFAGLRIPELRERIGVFLGRLNKDNGLSSADEGSVKG